MSHDGTPRRSHTRSLTSVVRGWTVTLSGVAVAFALTVLLWQTGAGLVTRSTWPAARPEDLLAGGCALTGAALAGWLAVGTALSALGRLPGALGEVCRVLARAVAPAALRRGVALLLGTTLVAAVAPGTAAAAATTPVAAARHTLVLDAPGPRTLDAGFRPPADTSWTPLDPDRPLPEWARETPPATTGAAPRQPLTLPAGTSNAREYVVRRGDSLWSIAARHLGPGATTAQIAAAWPQWYAVNAQTVGPDPDLISPGQHLVVPAHLTEATR